MHLSLTNLYFLAQNKKTIPETLALSPLTLAIWYMDDGSRCDTDIYFNSQQFSLEEQEKLVIELNKQFKVKSSLNRDKQYYRIRIKKESVSMFMKIISPYIIPSVKLSLTKQFDSFNPFHLRKAIESKLKSIFSVSYSFKNTYESSISS